MAYARAESKPEIVAATVPAELTVPGLTFVEDAAAALAGLAPGAARFWLSKGATSLVDVITAALDLSGPAFLWLTTWTVAPREAGRLAALLADARIVGLRLLTDDSLRRRHPAYLATWRARFGVESIRLAKVHAKLAVLEGARATVTVAASANLSSARRLESFAAFMGDEPAATITRALAHWFGQPPNHKDPHAAIGRAFDAWGAEGAARPHGRRSRRGPMSGLACDGRGSTADLAPACDEDRPFFGDGLLACDVRRRGVTFEG